MTELAHSSTEPASGTLVSAQAAEERGSLLPLERGPARTDLAWMGVLGAIGVIAVVSVVAVAIVGFESVRECVEHVR